MADDETDTGGDPNGSYMIPLFTVEREGQSTFDPAQLALKDIDRTSSFYYRKLIMCPGAEASRDKEKGGGVSYSPALLLRYRTDWLPTGYGLGDLIYSISLMPNEEVTLEVKTWETDMTSTETDAASEASRKSDVSAEQTSASEVIDDVTLKLQAHVDASCEVDLSGVGSADVSAGASTEYTDHTQSTVSLINKYVTQSSNEMKTARTIKMTVSRESGREDKTTRKIKNINQVRTLNLNYYQVLQEFTVSTHLTDVSLVLLGKEFEPTQATAANFVISRPSLPARYASPTVPEMVNALFSYSLFKDNPLKFRNLLLRFLTPLPSVSTTPTPAGGDKAAPVFRYVYQIHPGRESALLEALRGNKDSIVKNVVSTLNSAKNNAIGQVGSSWKVTLPTHGIYGESILGRFSGGEDYIEVNRQFDLELKQLEIERLKLEVERLKLNNERLAQNVPRELLVSNPGGSANLTLNVSAEAAADGESTQIKVNPE